MREPRLLRALGVTAPLAILILGIAGKDVAISRYTTVAAAMLLTGIAAAIVALPRLPATALTALVATAAVWGLTQIHRTANFYAPARETLAFIQAHQLPDSVIVIPVSPGAAIPLGYYAPLILHPVHGFVLGTDRPSIMRLLRERKPIWVIRDTRRLDRPISELREGAAAAMARTTTPPASSTPSSPAQHFCLT